MHASNVATGASSISGHGRRVLPEVPKDAGAALDASNAGVEQGGETREPVWEYRAPTPPERQGNEAHLASKWGSAELAAMEGGTRVTRSSMRRRATVSGVEGTREKTTAVIEPAARSENGATAPDLSLGSPLTASQPSIEVEQEAADNSSHTDVSGIEAVEQDRDDGASATTDTNVPDGTEVYRARGELPEWAYRPSNAKNWKDRNNLGF
ncbi:hypothetical protein C8F01DRAFT_1192137 [Mycena amicta]|nr:hypothetical protein C8F01DRAFT_1192137 [Mycena amicta]